MSCHVAGEKEMKTMKLKIDTENDVFVNGGKAEEVSRILREVADSVLDGETRGVCMDTNGNRVGEWRLE